VIIPKKLKYLGNYIVYCGKMETVSIDSTGKIYMPKSVRKRINVKSKYLVLVLPDGDVILHRIKKSKNALKDFQKTWRITKEIAQVKKEIMEEAMKLAGK